MRPKERPTTRDVVSRLIVEIEQSPGRDWDESLFVRRRSTLSYHPSPASVRQLSPEDLFAAVVPGEYL
jgi:hypothetical protein